MAARATPSMVWLVALLLGAACAPAASPPASAGMVDAGEGGGADGGVDATAAPDATALPQGDVDAETPVEDPSPDAGDARGDQGDGGCGYPDLALDGPTGVRLRVVAANITSGAKPTYEAPGIRILQGLKPDLAMLQEFKYAAGDLRALVDLAFGPEFFFMSEVEIGGIPNGVVSRYPIIASGEWEDTTAPDRDFAYAQIDVPGPKDLWAVSVHLKTSDATTRSAEAKALVAQIKAAVPPGDYVIIGGDLNTSVESEAALVDLAEVAVVGPRRPVDQNGNDRTNAPRTKPYDWLLPSLELDARKTAVRVGGRVYCDGLVFDSRVFTPLAELPPVEPGDSIATNMQHMPVVRDFFLPSE